MGPSTSDDEVLRQLMLSGMNVARQNFSHGDHESHRKVFEQVKRIREELDLPVASLLDTKGPEVRVKQFKEGKEIVGNRKTLIQWQDEFWEYMVKKYPELERGESASETGRDHIPPRVFKQAKNLNKQWQYIQSLLGDINAFNAKKVSAELDAALRKFFPALGKFLTEMKKYDKTIRSLKADNVELQEELKKKIEAVKGIPPEYTFLGNGSDEAIDLPYRIFCRPGVDNVVAIEPTYGIDRKSVV